MNLPVFTPHEEKLIGGIISEIEDMNREFAVCITMIDAATTNKDADAWLRKANNLSKGINCRSQDMESTINNAINRLFNNRA